MPPNNNLSTKGVMKIKSKLTYLLGYWIISSIFIYVAWLLAPYNIVLGTASLSVWSASIVSGLFITIISWIFTMLLSRFKVTMKGMVQNMFMLWLVDIAAVWLTGRVGPYSGLGLTSYLWAIILGVFIGIGQSGVEMILSMGSRK